MYKITFRSEFCFFHSLLVFFLNFLDIEAVTSNYQHIESLVNNYTIDVTILEIAKAQDQLYSFDLAKKNNCTCIILLMNSGADAIIQRIKREKLENMVVLEPKELDGQMINALSKCEHIDISIIHDYFDHFQHNWRPTTDLFLTLGNHAFFEVSYDYANTMLTYKNPQLKMLENRFQKLLFYHQTEKKFLEIARFTQFNKAKDYGSNYEIRSTFNEKLLLKKNPETTSIWIAGINLLTFVMMRGVYPSDDIIRNQILTMEKLFPYHNDLIIGNMVIQGHSIIPIDFNDKRRSANMPKMVNRAVNFFNGDNYRLKNPSDKINTYYQKTSKSTKQKQNKK